MRLLTSTILTLSLVACASHSTNGSSTVTTTPTTEPPKEEFRLYPANNAQSSTTVVNAAIGALGAVKFDGTLIPIVSPGGQYLAVQEGDLTDRWDFILARPTDAFVPKFDIAIYRIDLVDGGPRQVLTKSHTLTGVGILGRHADEDGFLVEAPQIDGSRKIGTVDWQTGKVSWLVNRDVNAFATRSPQGRLAWCSREVDRPIPANSALEDAPFDLYVQGKDQLLRLPATDGGSWLMPIWSNDGLTLFAFHLAADGKMKLAVLNATSANTFTKPVQLHTLSLAGSAYWAFQATAANKQPAAPDGSPRILINFPAEQRTYEYDAQRDSEQRLRPLPRRTVAATWRNASELLCTTPGALYWVQPGPDTKPVELIRGLNIPYVTTHKRHPYILVSRDRQQTDRLLIWAMDLIDADTARKATEQLTNKNR